jgi:hypothetical protein
MRIRFLHEHSSRMSPKQERRATLPKAKPAGRGPWMGHVRTIGSVDIPQAEPQSGGERTGLNALSRAGHPMRRSFLTILKVEN